MVSDVLDLYGQGWLDGRGQGDFGCMRVILFRSIAPPSAVGRRIWGSVLSVSLQGGLVSEGLSGDFVSLVGFQRFTATEQMLR